MCPDKGSQTIVESSEAFISEIQLINTAIHGLTEALQDQSDFVRRNAVKALGQLNGENAIPGLMEALTDKDLEVRRNAAESLKRIQREEIVSSEFQGFADFVPLGSSVMPMLGTEDVMWTCKFRNGLIKRFKFPIRTTPEKSTVRRRDTISSPDSKIEANIIERFTKIEFPRTCKVNSLVVLKFQLTLSASLDSRLKTLLELKVFEGQKETIVRIFVTALSFSIDRHFATLTIPIDRDSESVSFKLTPHSIGTQIVEIEIYPDCERIGYYTVKTEVIK